MTGAREFYYGSFGSDGDNNDDAASWAGYDSSSWGNWGGTGDGLEGGGITIGGGGTSDVSGGTGQGQGTNTTDTPETNAEFAEFAHYYGGGKGEFGSKGGVGGTLGGGGNNGNTLGTTGSQDSRSLAGSSDEDQLANKSSSKTASLDGFDWIGASLPGQMTDYEDLNGMMPSKMGELPSSVQGEVYKLAQEYRNIMIGPGLPTQEQNNRMTGIEALRDGMPSGIKDSFGIIAFNNVGAMADKAAQKLAEESKITAGQIAVMLANERMTRGHGTIGTGAKSIVDKALGLSVGVLQGKSAAKTIGDLTEAQQKGQTLVSEMELQKTNAQNRGNYGLADVLQRQIDELSTISKSSYRFK
jgi:hypothetical protein